MVIEVRHDSLAAVSSALQQRTVSRLKTIQSSSRQVAQGELPRAGASEDLALFSQKLDGYSQGDLERLIRALTAYLNALRAIQGNYEQAQVRALELALRL